MSTKNVFTNPLFDMYKQDLVLDNQQWLKCRKRHQTKSHDWFNLYWRPNRWDLAPNLTDTFFRVGETCHGVKVSKASLTDSLSREYEPQ